MYRLFLLAAGAAALTAPAIAQDFNLPPTSGAISLRTGFTPDPVTVRVIGGGDIDADAALEAARCAGFIDEAPTFSLNFTAGLQGWPLILRAQSETPFTLLVNDPLTNWSCRGSEDGQAAVTYLLPLSGRYDIWVGNAESDETFEAALGISEIIEAEQAEE